MVSHLLTILQLVVNPGCKTMILDLCRAMFEPTTFLVFISFLFVAWYLYSSRGLNLPPGPTVWPLIGTMPYIRKGSKPLYARMMDAYHEFGPVVRLKVGPKINIVWIFGYDMIRKAGVEQNEDFRYRPNNLFLLKKVFNEKGLYLINFYFHFRRKCVYSILKKKRNVFLLFCFYWFGAKRPRTLSQ